MSNIKIEWSKCYDKLLKQAKMQEQKISYLNQRITEFDERKLKAGEAHEKQKWKRITTVDDYPKTSGPYLVKHVMGAILVSEFDLYEGTFPGFEDYCTEEITHWMPLPDPPGE